MQKLTITIFTTLLTYSAFASDFGTYTQRAKEHLKKERIRAIVSSSEIERSKVETTRDIASFSPQDKAWAKEYETLMNDNSERDYLKEALEL